MKFGAALANASNGITQEWEEMVGRFQTKGKLFCGYLLCGI